MIIRELQIYHYGKFHNKSLALAPGMNVIYGGNEAGKSTVHLFIQSMLFGVRRQRGKAALNDEYTRMLPWEDRGYEGLMVIEDQGRRYRLYRNFSREQEKFSVFDDVTGEEIKLQSGHIEELIPGLNLSNYKNTISIAQQAAGFDDKFAASLQSYLANMSTGGDSSVDIERAYKFLAEEERQIKGRMPVKAIEQLKREMEAVGDSEKKSADLQAQSYRLALQEQKISQKIEQDREEIQHLRETERKERVAGLHLIEEREQLLEKIAQVDQAASGRPDVGVFKQRMFWIFIVFTVLAVAAMALQMLMHIDHIVLKVMTACLLVAAVYCFARISFRKTTDVVDEKPYEQESLRIRNALKYYVKKYGHDMDGPGEVQALSAQLEQLDRERRQCQHERERIEWELEQLTEKTARRMQLEQDYEIRRQEMKKHRLDLESVALARMVIQEVSGEIHHAFGSRLNDEVAALFARISGGAKQQVLVDEQLHVHLDGMRQQIPLDRLSQGAVDQMYFALRSCAGHLIFEDTEVPMILDECFAYYDDRRLGQCLDWLAGENYPQIILFTCHHREADWLKAQGLDFHYIEL